MGGCVVVLNLVPGFVGRNDEGEVAVGVLEHVVEVILVAKREYGTRGKETKHNNLIISKENYNSTEFN